MRELHSLKQSDYLTTLPAELLAAISAFLTAGDLLTLAAVNKFLSILVMNSSFLWKRANFLVGNGCIQPSFLIVARRPLRLNSKGPLPHHISPHLLSRLKPRMNSIEAFSSKPFYDLTDEFVTPLLHLLPNLTNVDLSNNLGITDATIYKLVTTAVSIKSLNISKCCSLSPDSIRYITHNLSKLEILDISGTKCATTSSINTLMQHSNPHLTTLIARGCAWVEWDLIIDSIDTTSLAVLDVSHNLLWTCNTMRRLADKRVRCLKHSHLPCLPSRRVSSLETTIENTSEIGADDAMDIDFKYGLSPKLILNVSQCEDITVSCIEECKRLCSNSVDIIHSAVLLDYSVEGLRSYVKYLINQ